jgi:8-amino-7-oxononanoate synthase
MTRLSSAWAEEELLALVNSGLQRTLEPLSSPQGAVVEINGQRLVNFSSNDYLGLANHPRLLAAAHRAIDAFGVGAGASRLVVGDTALHRSLEAALCRFENAEAALLFNSGYAANIGILSAAVGEGDAIFSDALNHASLIDGCRLSRAKTFIYPHGDVEALQTLLQGVSARRKLVCTDAVFSMDGDLASLAAIARLCRAHGAALLVDEAHATGVLGPMGNGLCEALNLSPLVDFRMGTLGKALGVFGAYVVGARPMVSWLLGRARSFVFSTALPPSLCAAAQAAIECVSAEPELRERLWRNIRRLSAGLERLGFAAPARSAIFPVVLGAPECAMEASRRLRMKGFLVKPIRPPTVPQGTSRLRVAVSAAHSEADIDGLLSALASSEVRPSV